MPFKSTAQQRFMYARHPEIAQRWSNEMKRSKRKGAKEHPIKAAHLPGHVHKSQGTATVGKRLSGGSFQRGGSTIVAHGNLGPRDRRGTKLQRYGGGGVRRGTRKPLEEYSKGLTGVLEDAKLGMSMGRDLRPGMLVPGGGAKLTPGARAGKLLGASTATAGRTAATVGGAAVMGGGLVGLRNNQNDQNVNKYYQENRPATDSELAQLRHKHPIASRIRRGRYSQGTAYADDDGNRGIDPGPPGMPDEWSKRVKRFSSNVGGEQVNKGPVWTPTSVAMNSQPIGPSKPLSTAPVSTAAGGQVRQGALIPTSKPVQANVAGRAAGGQKSGSIRANGTMGAAATTGSVGATAAAQPTSKIPVTKADKSRRRAVYEGGDIGAGSAAVASGLIHPRSGTRGMITSGLVGGTVGSLGAYRRERKQERRAARNVAKADGTLTIRSHGPNRRYYDPESRRQRRMGQAQGATTVGGAAALGAGTHELVRSNREGWAISRKVENDGKHVKLTRAPHSAIVNRKAGTLIGAGALGLAASNKLRRHANNPHNREWS